MSRISDILKKTNEALTGTDLSGVTEGFSSEEKAVIRDGAERIDLDIQKKRNFREVVETIVSAEEFTLGKPQGSPTKRDHVSFGIYANLKDGSEEFVLNGPAYWSELGRDDAEDIAKNGAHYQIEALKLLQGKYKALGMSPKS